MPLDPPNAGEIIRRLDEMAARQDKILEEIKQDRAAMAATYVRQDVYMAERQMANAVVSDLRTDVSQLEATTERDIKSIKDDRKADQQQRRQLVMWLAALTVTVLFGIGGLVVSILTLVL